MELLLASQWRDLTPSNALNKSGVHKCKLIHASGFVSYLNPIVQTWVSQADIVTVQRNVIGPEMIDAIKYWMALGKPIAIDLDDAYHILPPSNPAHTFWKKREDVYEGERQAGAALKYLEEGLRVTGALIAPNRNLLADWSHVARGYYLQNYAETEWWSNLPPREELKKERGLEGRVIIGWGGSVSHLDSWEGSGIKEAARRISKRHPEVLWLICGNDARIYDHLPVERGQKLQQAGVPAEEWPRSVKVFDIGVAPLFGIYDQRRSWIKGIEYALAGVPWVGTAGEVYRDVADTGALVPNGADAWELALERKIANLKEEQALMEMRIPEARERFLVDSNLPAFEGVYRQVMADFQQRGQPVLLPGVMKL